MPDDEEWAFEAEIDLWDDGESSSPTEAEPEPDGPADRDEDSVVTVTVSPDGEIRQVRLAGDWKSKIDPRGLHSSVLTAANAATIEALALRARAVEDALPPPPPADADETPLTAQDVLRLEDAVRGELEQFSTRMAAAGTGVVTAESSGGHVSGRPRAAATSAWTSTRPGLRSRATPRSRANCSTCCARCTADRLHRTSRRSRKVPPTPN